LSRSARDGGRGAWPIHPHLEITAHAVRPRPALSRLIVGEMIGFALRWDGQKHSVL